MGGPRGPGIPVAAGSTGELAATRAMPRRGMAGAHYGSGTAPALLALELSAGGGQTALAQRRRDIEGPQAAASAAESAAPSQ